MSVHSRHLKTSKRPLFVVVALEGLCYWPWKMGPRVRKVVQQFELVILKFYSFIYFDVCVSLSSLKGQRVERLRRELFQIRHRIKFNAFQNQQCSHFFVQGPQFSFVCNAHWGVSLRNLVLYCYFLNQNMWINQPKLPWRKMLPIYISFITQKGPKSSFDAAVFIFQNSISGKTFRVFKATTSRFKVFFHITIEVR